MKKYIKWLLLLVLVVAMLTGCGKTEEPQAPEAPADIEIYYNVNASDYRGHPDTTPIRLADDEGRYFMQFAGNGEQQRFQVTREVIDGGIDMHDWVGLQFDENGVVVDFYSVEECTGGYFAKKYYVEEIQGNTVICNNSPIYDGFQVKFELNDSQQVYMADGISPLTGMPTTVQADDEITAIKDKDGNVFLIYVGHVGDMPDVYFSKSRMYDSSNKMTTRERDETGCFTYVMGVNGQEVTVQTKDADVATAMDKIAARNMVLTFDEDGMVNSAVEGSTVTGGFLASWCAVTGLDGANMEFTRTRSGSNQGSVYNGVKAKNFVAYDVSGMGGVYGAVTELRLGDTVHCLTNKRGQVCIAFVVERLADSRMYWNVSRKYDSTKKETTRYMWADGYYHVVVAVDGKQEVVRVPNRALVTQMDARADKHFGLKLNGDIVEAVYTPSMCTGGTYFASWCDVTEIKDGVVTALRTIEGSGYGKVYSCKMAPDCKIYNVTSTADTVGEVTTLRVGDRIHGETNMDGELVVIYVVANRTRANTKVYWNVNRKYNSTTKLSTREPDADGWYTFLLACEGEQVTVRTKDKDIVQKMDAKADRYFGLRVNKEGEITLYCSANDVTGGSYFASWCDVTKISGKKVTALRTLDGSNKGTSYTASMASNCKVYNVSDNYLKFAGEETTLRVGDRIQGQKNREGALVIIFVVSRPDIEGTPDHFHCACNGTAKGVGSHTCDENEGWSAWENPRRLPTSGHWYLTTDVTTTAGTTVAVNTELHLCLNGHTINGQSTGSGSVINANTLLTITDCVGSGEIISNNDAYGSVIYVYEHNGPAEVNIFGGTLRNSLEQKTKDGGIIYVGNQGKNPAVLNIYGGTIIGANFGSSCSGGAINLIKGADLNLYGGTITGGTADKGGAIAISAGDIYMSGGTITGNTARLGGGIYVGTNATLFLDNVTITGNKNVAGVGKDVYAVTQTTVTLNGKITLESMFFNANIAVPGPDGLDDTSSIPIHKVIAGPFFQTDDPNDFNCFTSYNKDYKLVYEDGKISTADVNPPHKHCACNGTAVGKGDHVCSELSYTAWTKSDSLPTSGNYYLTCDVTTTGGTSVPTGSKLNICLCGHTITGPEGSGAAIFFVNTGLSIADCSSKPGKLVARNDAYGSVMYLYEHQGVTTVDIFAGTLCSDKDSQTKDGGIIYIGNQGKNLATLNLYGGTIEGKTVTESGGAVNIIKGNCLNMYGGKITGGKAKNGGAVRLSDGSTFNMYGGTIENNTATSNGGAICAKGSGKIQLRGGTITDNSAGNDGGSIYITDTVTLDIYDGATVTKGTAGNEGGNLRNGSKSSINIYGGAITYGNAKNGGNLMIFGPLNMYGGKITHGTAKSFGGNICTWGSPVITLAKHSASTTAPNLNNGTATTGADIVLRGTAPQLHVSYGKAGYVTGLQGSVTVSDVGEIPKLHISGITVTAKDLQEGASIAISMATPGVFMTGCGDLTAFFKAFDSAYEVVYDGTDMILRKK